MAKCVRLCSCQIQVSILVELEDRSSFGLTLTSSRESHGTIGSAASPLLCIHPIDECPELPIFLPSTGAFDVFGQLRGFHQ